MMKKSMGNPCNVNSYNVYKNSFDIDFSLIYKDDNYSTPTI